VTQFRILLADNGPQIRSIIEAILKARNYLVDQANDGVEALKTLQILGGTVGLLITDIEMPRMDGVALARCAAEVFPTMPVLFMSGWPIRSMSRSGRSPSTHSSESHFCRRCS
jgi:CheY-like chemotaxis protein